MKQKSACQFVLSLYFVLLTVWEAGGTFIPGRCLCPETQRSVQGPLKDLKVVLRGPHCEEDTVIVYLKRDDSTAVCLNPESPVGKQLIRCWRRATTLKRDVKLCLRRRRRRRKEQKRSQQKTDTVQPRSAPASSSNTPARARGLKTHRQRSPQLRGRGRGNGRRSRMNRE